MGSFFLIFNMDNEELKISVLFNDLVKENGYTGSIALLADKEEYLKRFVNIDYNFFEILKEFEQEYYLNNNDNITEKLFLQNIKDKNKYEFARMYIYILKLIHNLSVTKENILPEDIKSNLFDEHLHNSSIFKELYDKIIELQSFNNYLISKIEYIENELVNLKNNINN